MPSALLQRPAIRGGEFDRLYEYSSGFGQIAGRRFEPVAERELQPAVRYLASRLPGNASGVLAAAEFPGPVGIADLVAVTRVQDLLAERLLADVPVLHSLSDAPVVAAIAVHRTTTAAQVSKILGISESQAARRIRELVNAGALMRFGNGFCRNPALKPIGRMYAFETKVSDWRKAIAQALRYAQWADAVGIVLLNSPRDLENIISYARNLRIGLAIGSQWMVKTSAPASGPGHEIARF